MSSTACDVDPGSRRRRPAVVWPEKVQYSPAVNFVRPQGLIEDIAKNIPKENATTAETEIIILN